MKIYDLEENKKLELEQFEVENSKINEIEEDLNNLRSKHFNIEEEKQSNQLKIEERKIIDRKINRKLEILKTKLIKEENLKKYLNQKNLKYNRKILKMNIDMVWKRGKIDFFDMIKSILDENPKIKREIRMYKI